MAVLKQIVVDCQRPSLLAKFWESALDDFAIRAYDSDEIERLASFGRTPETDPCVLLDSPLLEICFQEVDCSPSAKRPLHLDLMSLSRSDDVARLVGLGATVVEVFAKHTWLRDPEGNDFCIVDARSSDISTERFG